uniref:G-protein coupled receptors family 1 profile domain-containing protein n=1 Tax=Meloidogyne enterolobii TaxID=390850 RepID=A0A6V7WDN1_MELEN|nr:unnamed protein product [Meloidogyne enterolobii]
MNCSSIIELPPTMRFRWSHNGSVAICYSAVFVLSLIGNGFMFLILFRNQCIKRRRVHSLLLHMTVAQLLVTLVYIPKEIVHNLTIAWLGGDLLCRLCKFFDVFGVALSAGILVCLSLDRFYSILFPLYVINAKRSVQRMVIAAWLVAALSSLPQVYIFRTARHPCFTEFTQCVSADIIGLLSPNVIYWFSVLNIVQVYFIPLFVILFCYGSILVSISLKSKDTKVASEPEQPPKEQRNITKLALLRGHEIHQQLAAGRSARWRRTSSLATVPASLYFSKTQPKYYGTTGGENNNNINWSKRPSVAATNMNNGLRRTGGGDSYERAKSKTLKMTLVLVLAFLLCWTPYTIAMFIHFLRVQTEARPISPLLSKFLYAFAVFNSAISPYLYGYFSFNIRDECRQLRYLVFRSAPARCLLRHGDSTEESISHSRSPFGPLAPGQRDSRRRAMIRRESRVREGLMMCEEGQQQKRQSISAAKDSTRVVTGQQRAPKLGDTSRTFSLNTTATTLISNSSFSNGQCSAITRRRPRLNDDRDLMEVDSKEEEEDQEESNEVGERRDSLLICNENNE